MRNFKQVLTHGIAVFMLISLLAGSFPVLNGSSDVYASGKKVKMTAYDQVIKYDKVAYCAGAGNGIYKVNLKTGKVTTLVKPTWAFGNGSFIGCMKKKGKYLYYQEYSTGLLMSVNRVNIKTKKVKTLARGDEGICYAIKDKKLYVEWEKTKNDDFYYVRKVMKLNGKSKKKTSMIASPNTKKSNKKGYSVKYKSSGGYVKAYLKTPTKKIYLGKVQDESGW